MANEAVSISAKAAVKIRIISSTRINLVGHSIDTMSIAAGAGDLVRASEADLDVRDYRQLAAVGGDQQISSSKKASIGRACVFREARYNG